MLSAVNLATIIEGHPDDAVALIVRGRPTTFGELRGQVASLRTGLAKLGVGPGARVALLSANNWLFVVAELAVLGTGAAVVPLNPASPAPEIERELVAVGASVAIVGPSAAEAVGKIDRLDVPLEHIFAAGGVRLDGADPIDVAFDSGTSPAPVVERDADDTAVMVFTAGTSGPPRAAMLSHGNLLANLEQVQTAPDRALRATDVSLGALPLFHIFGLNVVLHLSLYAGGSVVLAERFDPAGSVELIRQHGVTVLAAAPPMYQAWAALPSASAGDFASVRLAVSGAAKLPIEVAEACEERLGVSIAEGYGLTEAAPTVTSSVGVEGRPGSIGVPLDGVEVRIVDDDGHDALAGDPGEIWVRGPNVFRGYLDDDAATARVITEDGWLRTGDVAVADDDGYLFLVDRAKDLIIVSGFNVYPAEVEDVLLQHPSITEAAVVGDSHPYSGEAVKAYVVANVELDEEQVIEWAASRLARYKCPSSVVFVDEIPRGLAGKALRRELRDLSVTPSPAN
jgi:long-chain acyl-CoA synthetase